ncbi:hypothetical protein SO3561_08434 [Streptomyces olivochromogenes]|uniref:Uncharacterized protein n=1 Tax=Streptomyces olivochromogenes TaxID=1963 RepID=A0A250VRZ1_STROL|nr:hypothetical protein SO3561_08434 [Streptomyces olivochromogenes]
MRGEEGVARGDGADGVEECVGADVFAEEAAGSGAEGLGDVFVDFEGGEDEDAGGVEVGVGADGGGGGEAVGVGHADVHEDDVGLVDAGEVDGFFAVGGFVDDFEVGAGVDQDPEGRPEQGLVVGEQHADGHGVRSSSGAGVYSGRSVETSKPPSAR